MSLALKRCIDLWFGSFLIFLLHPLAKRIKARLKRDHDLTARGDIAFIKLLGGGSLVIALPALLAIRAKYPSHRISIVTSPSIAPFAESLKIFDRIVVINDQSLLALLFSSARALGKVFFCDTFVDLEVHSRLTTVFALFTCARNRIGLFREESQNRTSLVTHPVFFNIFYGSYYFYERIALMLGAELLSDEEVRAFFRKQHNLSQATPENGTIAIAPGCSDLSKERMLNPGQWLQLMEKNIEKNKKYTITFLGNRQDKKIADSVIAMSKAAFPDLKFLNECGKLTLQESIARIHHSSAFWGIDSAPLHYARLLGVNTLAYFGPTNPQYLLKPLTYAKEEIQYKQLPCSPCVHVKNFSPCRGNNTCISQHFP